MSTRQEFSEGVKRTVAQRAAYLCSRPECHALTVVPHSDPQKALTSGVAAHICAAAPGGPRFDSEQTEEERTGIDNAIWLCHACSDLVDKDPPTYSKDVLLNWKADIGKFIVSGGGIPALPSIRLETGRGLTLTSGVPAQVTGDDIMKYREHWLEVSHQSRRMLRYLHLRIQFPEPVVGCEIVKRPVGAAVTCEPERIRSTAIAKGSGSSVTMYGGKQPTPNYQLEINELPPNSELVIRFVSQANGSPAFDLLSDVGINGEQALFHHIMGEFQFQILDQYSVRKFCVPLIIDAVQRAIKSLPVEDYEEAKSRRKIFGTQQFP
ncbi:MAG: hypothetical protein Q7T26_11940 [Dehalococcoidia bacterium]|nr:hypothetical protein [Dehalococcoidia bacterium]